MQNVSFSVCFVSDQSSFVLTSFRPSRLPKRAFERLGVYRHALCVCFAWSGAAGTEMGPIGDWTVNPGTRRIFHSFC